MVLLPSLEWLAPKFDVQATFRHFMEDQQASFQHGKKLLFENMSLGFTHIYTIQI